MDFPAEHEKNVFGQFDEYVKKIERALNVTIISRDGKLKILGNETSANQAQRVISQLLMLSKRGNTITEQNVDYTLSLTFEEKEGQMAEMDRDFICHTINGRPIKPKTLGQKSYVDEIRKKMFVFEDILSLDDRAIQRVLRDVDNGDLALALKGAAEEVQNVILNNLSKRLAVMIKEDMEYMGPVRMKDVEEAQQKIVYIIRKLEDSAEIVIARGGGDEIIV